jgi:ubiquinone/menaquinone biosynthesis C-methylase UbiE
MAHKFDPKNIEKLDDPERTRWQNIEAFLEVLQPWEAMIYADIGCGVGYFTLPVAERIGPQGKAYGVDLLPEMLEELERRAQAKGLKNVIPVRSREQEIPLPEASVDAVCSAGTFHEFEEPETLLREIWRILKPGGRFFLIDWKPIETPEGPPLEVRVPLERLFEALQAAGFEDLREHPIYPYHYVVEGVKGLK